MNIFNRLAAHGLPQVSELKHLMKEQLERDGFKCKMVEGNLMMVAKELNIFVLVYDCEFSRQLKHVVFRCGIGYDKEDALPAPGMAYLANETIANEGNTVTLAVEGGMVTTYSGDIRSMDDFAGMKDVALHRIFDALQYTNDNYDRVRDYYHNGHQPQERRVGFEFGKNADVESPAAISESGIN